MKELRKEIKEIEYQMTQLRKRKKSASYKTLSMYSKSLMIEEYKKLETKLIDLQFKLYKR